MRSLTRSAPALLLGVASAVAVGAIVPALAQRAPESILPPGFGQPEPPASPLPREPARPSETTPPASSPGGNDVPDIALTPPAAGDDAIGETIDTLDDNVSVATAAPVDLPPGARRSLDRVGLLAAGDGGFGENAFGDGDGRFLTGLMRSIDAPLASRWTSILLRRALLSPTSIPRGVDGADWVAERAWLLLRMGEADMGRALIARVDAENFTPRLSAIAMQAALATADPSAICPIADAAASTSDEPSWPLAQAMCAGLSGESGTASALVDRVRDKRRATGIDVLLAEKVIGAGGNSRRAVNIQWDGVEHLTAWRFGLATATGVTIPMPLYATAGPQVQAWLARAPLIAPTARLFAIDRAGELGVLSSAAMTDFYADLWDATDPAERSGSVAESLRGAWAGSDAGARLGALRTLWGRQPTTPYARQLLTARAAAMIGTDAAVSVDDMDRLIAAMLSAGLDIQAARWGGKVSSGAPGWAMLAVATPRPGTTVTASEVRGVTGGDGDLRAKFLLAGLAGLGRLSASDATDLAQRYGVPLGRGSSWTAALDRAAAARETATVALIAAAGMQTRDWRFVPPEHLYHIVAALRRVGLEPEARMIAAEALARS